MRPVLHFADTFSDDPYFYLEGLQADLRRLGKSAGFKLDSKFSTWYTRNPGRAFKLREYADDAAKKELRRQFITHSPWLGRLSDFTPAGLSLFPHQIESIKFALERNRSYLGLAPRLGKTVISAMVRNVLQIPLVYITPPSLTRNVEAEFLKWSMTKNLYPPSIFRYEGKRPYGLKPDVLIVPDSIIGRREVYLDLLNMIPKNGEALLIVDEAHRFKTPTSDRTRALFGKYNYGGLVKHFSRQIYLSGTPMPNRPIELFPILSNVAPETIQFRERYSYGLRYCAGVVLEPECPVCKATGRIYRHQKLIACSYCKGQGYHKNGLDVTGSSNLKELQTKVHGKFMLRIKDVPNLPKRLEEVVIIGDNAPKLIALERKLLLENSPEDLMAETASEFLSRYRKDLGILKVKKALQFIKDILDDENESVLVFAFHKEVVARLMVGLKSHQPMLIVGGTDNKARHEVQQTFNTDPTRRLVILNYIAGGLGLNLSKATRVVMVEYSWVPSDNQQAAERANRIGGKDVLVQYLVLENSLDRKVLEVNLKKRKVTGFI